MLPDGELLSADRFILSPQEQAWCRNPEITTDGARVLVAEIIADCVRRFKLVKPGSSEHKALKEFFCGPGLEYVLNAGSLNVDPGAVRRSVGL